MARGMGWVGLGRPRLFSFLTAYDGTVNVRLLLFSRFNRGLEETCPINLNRAEL